MNLVPGLLDNRYTGLLRSGKMDEALGIGVAVMGPRRACGHEPRAASVVG